MPFYPAALPLSTATLTRVSALIRAHRTTIRSRWRRLALSDQAFLTLAYLHKGDRLRTLAAGFGISEAPAWRRMRETISLLAVQVRGLHEALRQAKHAGWAFVILDGTLIRAQRHRLDRPFYSDKYCHHGMNFQVIVAPSSVP